MFKSINFGVLTTSRHELTDDTVRNGDKARLLIFTIIKSTADCITDCIIVRRERAVKTKRGLMYALLNLELGRLHIRGLGPSRFRSFGLPARLRMHADVYASALQPSNVPYSGPSF